MIQIRSLNHSAAIPSIILPSIPLITSKKRLACRCCALFLLCLFCTPARAAESVAVLADRLPESTMLYMGWQPDAAVADTLAAKMLADPRMTGPWNTLFQSKLSAQANAGFSFFVLQNFPQLLDTAVRCPGAFALLDFKPQKDHHSIQAVLILDLTDQRQAFEAKFTPLQVKAKELLGENLQMMKFAKSWLWTTTFHDKPLLTWLKGRSARSAR